MLRRAFLSTFAANFATNVLASGGVLILALFLEEPDVGVIRSLQSYVIIGITIASMGFTTGILKYCSLSSEFEANERLLNKSIIFTSFVSLGYVMVGAIITAMSSPVGEDTNLTTLLPFALASVPLGVAIELFRNFLYARNRFEAAASAQIFVKLWTFIITIVLAYAYGLPGYVAGTFMSFLFGAIRFSKAVPFSLPRLEKFKFPSDFLKFSAFAMLGNLFVIVGNYGDILLLSLMDTERNVLGAYALASALTGGIMVVTTSVQTIVSPDMIRGVTSPRELKQSFIKNQLRLAGLSVGVAVFSAIFVTFFFPIVYGEKYLLTPAIFSGLCVNYVLVSCGTLGGSILMGYGRTSTNTSVAGISLLVGFLSGLLLIPQMDVWGMVWAKFLYGVIFVILSNTLALKCLKKPLKIKDST